MRAIGLVLAGGNNNRMRELTLKRAIAAMPVAGSYRAIDFVLSNMVNSRIQKVAVLTQYNAKSLNQHLSSSKWWDFGRKKGGLYVFTPSITANNSDWYQGTADAIHQNINFLKDSHEPYVIIAGGEGIYKLDYNKVLEQHILKKADITVVTKEFVNDYDSSRFGVVKVNDDGKIIDFEEKPEVTGSKLVSTGVYIIRRRLLIDLIEKAASRGEFDFINAVILENKEEKSLYSYKMDTYWDSVSSAEAYYNINMDFLKKDIRDHLLKGYPEIYTKVEDLPPAKYNPGTYVKNSLIASGCIINGHIENSVLCKKAYIGNNCIIKNSIILNNVYIGDNSYIENCIVESRDTINPNTTHIGESGNIKIVMEKNIRYGY